MVIVVLMLVVAVGWLIPSIRRNLELYESNEELLNSIEKHKSEMAFWMGEAKRIAEQRDAMQADNERLRKSASKLVMQVAESFGKEATNPKPT